LQTSKDIVRRCLTFDWPERMPWHLWHLPWAEIHYPQMMRELNRRFPSDLCEPDYCYQPSSRVKGDPYKVGIYIDEWGCHFKNIQNGVIGEVDQPVINEISDWNKMQPPYEQLPDGKIELKKMYDQISRYYERSDKFVLGRICPRPWERYQFIRGTENAMLDVMMMELGGKDLLQKIHTFYLSEMEIWVKSAVDGINFMDDWGSQNQLLIHPDLWRAYFKPLYKEYCDLAHAHGKFIFMHSDGFIQDIYEDLIEIGVNAINSQLFCMDMVILEAKAKGKITFWGEIDRQHVLPSKIPQDGRDAVRKVAKHLYDPRGGIIAQLEFGAGANPDTVMAVFEEWEDVQRTWVTD
jgi:hypothetical protein